MEGLNAHALPFLLTQEGIMYYAAFDEGKCGLPAREWSASSEYNRKGAGLARFV